MSGDDSESASGGQASSSASASKRSSNKSKSERSSASASTSSNNSSSASAGKAGTSASSSIDGKTAASSASGSGAKSPSADSDGGATQAKPSSGPNRPQPKGEAFVDAKSGVGVYVLIGYNRRLRIWYIYVGYIYAGLYFRCVLCHLTSEYRARVTQKLYGLFGPSTNSVALKLLSIPRGDLLHLVGKLSFRGVAIQPKHDKLMYAVLFLRLLEKALIGYVTTLSRLFVSSALLNRLEGVSWPRDDVRGANASVGAVLIGLNALGTKISLEDIARVALTIDLDAKTLRLHSPLHLTLRLATSFVDSIVAKHLSSFDGAVEFVLRERKAGAAVTVGTTLTSRLTAYFSLLEYDDAFLDFGSFVALRATLSHILASAAPTTLASLVSWHSPTLTVDLLVRQNHNGKDDWMFFRVPSGVRQSVGYRVNSGNSDTDIIFAAVSRLGGARLKSTHPFIAERIRRHRAAGGAKTLNLGSITIEFPVTTVDGLLGAISLPDGTVEPWHVADNVDREHSKMLTSGSDDAIKRLLGCFFAVRAPSIPPEALMASAWHNLRLGGSVGTALRRVAMSMGGKKEIGIKAQPTLVTRAGAPFSEENIVARWGRAPSKGAPLVGQYIFVCDRDGADVRNRRLVLRFADSENVMRSVTIEIDTAGGCSNYFSEAQWLVIVQIATHQLRKRDRSLPPMADWERAVEDATDAKDAEDEEAAEMMREGGWHKGLVNVTRAVLAFDSDSVTPSRALLAAKGGLSKANLKAITGLTELPDADRLVLWYRFSSREQGSKVQPKVYFEVKTANEDGFDGFVTKEFEITHATSGHPFTPGDYAIAAAQAAHRFSKDVENPSSGLSAWVAARSSSSKTKEKRSGARQAQT